MWQRGTWTGRISGPPGHACLIASVTILALVGHGNLSAPARFDGAGYAVLARSLAEGRGYRAIDHPDRPRHAHFPPGYPAFLALVQSIAGVSSSILHLASAFCAVGATLASWCWFRRIYPRDAALVLGMALAVNWVWARTGAAIQSEPLYEILCQGTILAAVVSASDRRPRSGAALGTLMGACLLTRHVALGLIAAILLDLMVRGQMRKALAATAVAALMISPWIAWVAVVGSGRRTQASLLDLGSADLPARLMTQASFYVQRIPDQIVGPVVEVATAVGRSPGVSLVANLWAVLGTGVILTGGIRAIRRPRVRLAGMIPLLTLALLLAWPYTEAGRFLVPLIPCLLIGATEGLVLLVRLVIRMRGLRISHRKLVRVAAVLVLIASIPYSAYAILTGRSRARDLANRDFDAACAWLAREGSRPGPVLTRHPGEVFLATGRQALEVPSAERPGEDDASPEEVARAIDRYGVAYLVLDEARYAGEPRGPLARFVAERPERVRLAWRRERGPAEVAVYEVLPAAGPHS